MDPQMRTLYRLTLPPELTDISTMASTVDSVPYLSATGLPTGRILGELVLTPLSWIGLQDMEHTSIQEGIEQYFFTHSMRKLRHARQPFSDSIHFYEEGQRRWVSNGLFSVSPLHLAPKPTY